MHGYLHSGLPSLVFLAFGNVLLQNRLFCLMCIFELLNFNGVLLPDLFFLKIRFFVCFCQFSGDGNRACLVICRDDFGLRFGFLFELIDFLLEVGVAFFLLK